MDDNQVQSEDDGAPAVKKFMDAKFYNAAVEGNIHGLMEKQAELDRLLTPQKTMDDIQVQNEDEIQIHIEDDAAPVVKKFMDAKFYNAAVEGNIHVLMEKQAELDSLLTPRNNTILHIHILARKLKSTEFLEWALDMCPLLVFQANIKGETPLHMAARYGDQEAVEVLIQRAKSVDDVKSGYKQQMLWVTNNEEDTALHEAVRMEHIEVVRLLIGEDPGHSYRANVAGLTPLYLAVERGYNDIAFKILERCTSLTHQGPIGRTTLHAAVIMKNYEMTKRILGKTGSTLTSKVDDDGWTPLHHSAKSGDFRIFVALLEKDKSAAYIPCKTEQWTALHVAIRYRRLEMMKALILQCPDCAEVVDGRGWNVFHLAVEVADRTFWSGLQTFQWLLKRPLLKKQLINDKDSDGNTPLHRMALARYWNPGISHFILKQPIVDKNALNNENKTPLDLVPSSEHESRIIVGKTYRTLDMRRMGCQPSNTTKARHDWKLGEGARMTERLTKALEKTREQHLVVATLIATVTFAAGFTLPGGYISEKGPDQGSPIMSRETAFRAFVISDTIAMVLSSCVVFLHLWMAAMSRSRRTYLSYPWAVNLTVIAMGAMVIAFTTGTYAVLGHSKLLASSVIIISIFFFFFSFCMFVYLAFR